LSALLFWLRSRTGNMEKGLAFGTGTATTVVGNGARHMKTKLAG